MLIFDIETGPGPWDEISKFMPPFDPGSVKGIVTGEFDPASVKTGNLGDIKAREKIEKARVEHNAALANSAQLLADAEAKHKAAFLDKAALEPTTGRVLAIGYGGSRIDGKKIIDAVSDQRGEGALIEKFWSEYVNRRNAGQHIIGHNILGFDLPFMIRRSWMLNVDVPASVRPPPGRYFDSLFVDTQEVWLCGDRWGGTPSNLNIVSKAFGLTGKNGNGKDFAELLASDYDAAVNYLRNDLELTANVAARMGVI